MTDALEALVRRRDPDRFLSALFAPTDKRRPLLALFALNHELARAREVASTPTMALIRLQWWREVVEGAVRRHEVAAPLREGIESGALQPPDLLAMIDAREVEADEEIGTLAEWRGYLRGTAGGVAVAAARLLGAPDPERLRDGGAAYGAAGVLRSAAFLARQGRSLLPGDVLSRHGLTVHEAIAGAKPGPLAAARAELASEALALADTRGLALPRSAIAAALPLVLARRDLRHPERSAPGPRGLADRLAVVLAGLRGRF